MLKASNVRIYGTEVQALMDSGAIPNVLLKDLVTRLCVVPQETNKNINDATGVDIQWLGPSKTCRLLLEN